MKRDRDKSVSDSSNDTNNPSNTTISHKKQKTYGAADELLPMELWIFIWKMDLGFEDVLRLREVCHYFRASADQHIIKPYHSDTILRHLNSRATSLAAWKHWHSVLELPSTLGWAHFLTSFYYAIERDDLECCEWFATTFPTIQSRKGFVDAISINLALLSAVEQGRLPVLNWFYDKKLLPPHNAQGHKFSKDALWKCAPKGNLEMCKWIVEKLQPPLTNIREDSWWVVRRAAQEGHTAVLQYLRDAFHLSRDYRASMLILFDVALGRRNQTEFLSYQTVFEFTTHEIRSYVYRNLLFHHQYNLFQDVVLRGNLDNAEWMRVTFRLTAADARADDNYALRKAAARGQLDACKWLYTTFELTPEDIATNDYYAMRKAIHHKHVDVVSWAIETCALSYENCCRVFGGQRNWKRLESSFFKKRNA